MAPFLWLVRRVRSRRGLLLGLAFGLAYFGSLLWWIERFGQMAWSAITIVSALAVALFGLLAVTVEFLAVLDLSGATHGMSDLFVWCLWVGVAPVACALTFLVVQRSMTTPQALRSAGTPGSCLPGLQRAAALCRDPASASRTGCEFPG